MVAVIMAAAIATGGPAAADPAVDAAEAGHGRLAPLWQKYCHECHGGGVAEGDVDLVASAPLDRMRADVTLWQRVADMVATRQMPPPEAAQPTAAERAAMQEWLQAFLAAEARAHAGDPGRVVLRRLNNAEYTFTIRDLTGVESLDPAREFPADSGAGEGFTNTGQSLVMSPALVAKYLDAAKDVARHVVPLPDGVRFSAGTSRRDFADEAMERVRGFYRRFTRPLAASLAEKQTTVQQGITLDLGHDGFLPVEEYLAATCAVREAAGNTAGGDAAQSVINAIIDTVAGDRGLNAKYLGTLWRALSAGGTAGGSAGRAAEAPASDSAGDSLVLDGLRRRWTAATPADASAVAADVAAWQAAVWKFNSAGQIGRHLGRPDGPASWLEAVTPLAPRREFRMKLAPPPAGDVITLHLAATDAGDGTAGDVVVWENPRLVAEGRSDIPLCDLRRLVAVRQELAVQVAPTAAACLAAAAEAAEMERPATPEAMATIVAALAQKHGVDSRLLAGWLRALGIGAGEAGFDTLLDTKRDAVDGYAFVKAWAGEQDLLVAANASDDTVRVPGTIKPHGITVHPAQQRQVVVGWKSPVAGTVEIEATVQRAHIGCGNGVTWSLEAWRGGMRQRLAGGTLDNAKPAPTGKIGPVAVRRGDAISLAVGSRDGNHSCDTTAVDLTIRAGETTWDLSRDVSAELLAGNPHADAHGNDAVWHFASEPRAVSGDAGIPTGSLLARWQGAATPAERTELAAAVQRLLAADATEPDAAELKAGESAESTSAEPKKDSPDATLRRSLLSLGGLLLGGIAPEAAVGPPAAAIASPVVASPAVGADPAVFGRHPHGLPVAERDLCLGPPDAVAVSIPWSLAEGYEFVTVATLHPAANPEASVQPEVRLEPAAAAGLSPALPVVARKDTAAWRRFEKAFADVRDLFPRALCYARIVPVDEVVTLNIYYREDDQLRRLMLDDEQAAELDRLWDELLFVSQEPLELADAHEQLLGYTTQDRGDMTGPFAAMRPAIESRASAFRTRLRVAEPAQLDAIVALAGRAWRRPLVDREVGDLRDLYATLRGEGLPHEEALAMLLTRVLVAADFLYKTETPPPGAGQGPVPGAELAARLSYFLWSSLPDRELMEAAAAGRLDDAAGIAGQMRRMLRDPKARRLAEEFGTQWLHVHGFAAHDEKSAEAFPTFAALRGAMEEETVLFLADFFQNDRSILSLLDADHTFLNGDLARHYGIDGVAGDEWRRVDGVRRHGRGGILGLATTLATQSGASRTSPILRGNWTSEVLLGEKLPKPPKDVPQLADTVPAGLTERQLITLHSSNEACAKCHARIDPYGFALEQFDAIGRFRTHDAAGHPIDAATRLVDGTAIAGHEGLRDYLLTVRRDTFVRQFCRKLLGYALGRAVQLSDEPLLDEIQARVAANGHRVGTALEAIVTSRQFREIRGADAVEAGE